MMRSAGGLARSHASASATVWLARRRVNSRRAWSATELSRLGSESGGMTTFGTWEEGVAQRHLSGAGCAVNPSGLALVSQGLQQSFARIGEELHIDAGCHLVRQLEQLP